MTLSDFLLFFLEFPMFKSAQASVLAVLAVMLAAVAPAHAAVPTEVTTTLSSALTDVGTIGASVFGIVVAIALFKWFRRAL
jgi:purine-cytosine permease-like protein